MTTTADELLKILDEAAVNTLPTMSCRECRALAKSYRDRLTNTRRKEALFRASKEDSPEERRFARQVSQAVRLEAHVARRVILHLATGHRR